MNVGAAVGDDAGAVGRNRALLGEAMGRSAGLLAPGPRHARRPRWRRRRHAGRADPRSRCRVTSEAGRRLRRPGRRLPAGAARGAGRSRRRRGACGLAGPCRRAWSKPPSRRSAQAGQCAPGDVVAWLGACIGPDAFEVGADVLVAFGAALGTTKALVPAASRPKAAPSGWPTCPDWHETGWRQPASARSAAAHGAPSPTRHGSSRSGATASPAAWPPPSGSPRADASSRRRAARRDGVPTRYSTIDRGSTP